MAGSEISDVFSKRMNEFFKKGAVYSAGSFFQQLIYFILLPVYTDYLSTGDFGIVSLMSVTSILILNFTKTAPGYSLVRFYYAPEYTGKRKVLFSGNIFFAAAVSIFIASVFALTGSFWAEAILDSKDYLDVIYVYSGVIFLQPLSEIAQDLLKMQKKALKFVIMHISSALLTASLVVYLMVFHNLTYLAMIWGVLFANAYQILFMYSDIWKLLLFKIDKETFKRSMAYGMPLVVTTLSIFLNANADQYIIKHIIGIESVGKYYFGDRFALLVSFLLVIPLQSIVSPITFELENRKKELNAFLKNAGNMFMFISVLFALGISLFSPEIIKIMAQKPEYYSAWKVVPLLALAYVLAGAFEITGKGILLAKKSTTYAAVFLIAAVLNLSLSYFLINLFGIQGAAAAKVFTYILLNIVLLFLSIRFYRISPDYYSILLIIIIGALVYSVSLLPDIESLIWKMIFKAGLVVFFIGLMLALRIIEKKDIKLMTGLRK